MSKMIKEQIEHYFQLINRVVGQSDSLGTYTVQLSGRQIVSGTCVESASSLALRLGVWLCAVRKTVEITFTCILSWRRFWSRIVTIGHRRWLRMLLMPICPWSPNALRIRRDHLGSNLSINWNHWCRRSCRVGLYWTRPFCAWHVRLGGSVVLLDSRLFGL